MPCAATRREQPKNGEWVGGGAERDREVRRRVKMWDEARRRRGCVLGGGVVDVSRPQAEYGAMKDEK